MSVLAIRINDQQLNFAHEYVLGDTPGNGTQSAIKAGYAVDCARQTASRLLRHEGVRAEIDKVARQALGDHASAAIDLLGRVIDGTSPAEAKNRFSESRS